MAIKDGECLKEMKYKLKRNKRSKNIRIRLDQDGEVMVTAPTMVPKSMIERFVKKSDRWIKRQQQKQSLRNSSYPVLDWEDKLISFKGKLYYWKFSSEIDRKIVVGRKYMYVNPVTGLEKDVRKTMLQWLKKEAVMYIDESVRIWSVKMGIQPGTISYRQQKSRWGSCSARGNLSFNWRLIHFNPGVIDYVVIHELAHIKHHNHSRKYWSLVEEFDPDYKTKVRFLKNQVIRIER